MQPGSERRQGRVTFRRAAGPPLVSGINRVYGKLKETAFLVGAELALRSDPRSERRDHVCYVNSNGRVRIVGSNAACRRTERALALGGSDARLRAQRQLIRSRWGRMDAARATPIAGGEVPLARESERAQPVPWRGARRLRDHDTQPRDDPPPGSEQHQDGTLERFHLPERHPPLQTALAITTATEVQLRCITANNSSPQVIARYRQLDAIQVDALVAVSDQ
jgi:hypothetical protein